MSISVRTPATKRSSGIWTWSLDFHASIKLFFGQKQFHMPEIPHSGKVACPTWKYRICFLFEISVVKWFDEPKGLVPSEWWRQSRKGESSHLISGAMFINCRSQFAAYFIGILFQYRRKSTLDHTHSAAAFKGNLLSCGFRHTTCCVWFEKIIRFRPQFAIVFIINHL